jgi:hypothetical protein
MTVTTTAAAPAVGGPHASRKTILITVHEVLLGTAPALRRQRPKPRRNYPKHYEYFERALMGREMDRL